MTKPAGTICRGCGGNGLDCSLTPREMQIAMQEITLRKTVTHNGAVSGSIARLRITDEPHKARLAFGGPLTHVLAEIERLGGLGYFVTLDMPWDGEPPKAEWKCRWCHGTGVPQLSREYMELVMRAAPRLAVVR